MSKFKIGDIVKLILPYSDSWNDLELVVTNIIKHKEFCTITVKKLDNSIASLTCDESQYVLHSQYIKREYECEQPINKPSHNCTCGGYKIGYVKPSKSHSSWCDMYKD